MIVTTPNRRILAQARLALLLSSPCSIGSTADLEIAELGWSIEQFDRNCEKLGHPTHPSDVIWSGEVDLPSDFAPAENNI